MAAALAVAVIAAVAPAPAASEKGVDLVLAPAQTLRGPVSGPWTTPDFDDGAWSAAAGTSNSPAAVAPPSPASPGPLRIRRRFDVDAPERIRALELRISYADGLIAFLNGVQIAVRGLAEGAGPEDLPVRPHGPEVESIYVEPAPGALRPRGNVLAVEIRGKAPAGTVGLKASAGVEIVRGPYLARPRETEMTVIWETNLPATGSVTLSPDEQSPMVVRGPRRPSHRQVVRLTGLRPDTTYRYVAEATAAPAADVERAGPLSFRTPPRRGKPLRFAVYGDMRAPGHADHAAVVAGLIKEAPPFVVNTGDLVNRGNEESDWQRYFQISSPLGVSAAVVPALGNHDAGRGGLGARKTWDLFDMPTAAGSEPGYTSFEIAGVHFIILDSNRWASAAQRDWLRADLARAQSRRARRRLRAIFAFCHDGPFSNGPHGGNAEAARVYAPLLQAAKVDMLFSGHDHLYQRGAVDGLPYIVSGGGGAPLYDPTCVPRNAVRMDTARRPLPDCPAAVATIARAHHYVMVEVSARTARFCPRFPDGTTIEPCVTFDLAAVPPGAGRRSISRDAALPDTAPTP